MYVQAMEHFPGVVIDEDLLRIYVDTNRFLDEIPMYLERENDPSIFVLTEVLRFTSDFSRLTLLHTWPSVARL